MLDDKFILKIKMNTLKYKRSSDVFFLFLPTTNWLTTWANYYEPNVAKLRWRRVKKKVDDLHVCIGEVSTSWNSTTEIDESDMKWEFETITTIMMTTTATATRATRSNEHDGVREGERTKKKQQNAHTDVCYQPKRKW